MSGPRLLSLAWRNLWRQKRRTVLTLVSIAFGGFLALFMTALQDKSFADFIDNAAKLGAGHVTIQHPEYIDKPTLSRTVEESGRKRTLAETDPEVLQATERASGQAMVATAKDSFGAFFIAYDPTVETEDTFEITSGLVEGRLFDQPDDDGIILGTVLARNLGAELGDKIVFTLTDKNGEIVSGMERVTGMIKTGATSLDAGLVLLPIDTVRGVVGYDPTESSQVAVFLGDGRDAVDVAERLEGELAGSDAVLTWDQVQPEIKAFVAMKIGGGRFMELVIAVLVAAGIFNTIFMSVMERTREFGIMLAVGYSPRQIFGLVMGESGLLAGMGLLAAFAIFVLPYRYMKIHGIDMSQQFADAGGNIDIGGVGMDPVMRFGIYPENAVIIAVAIVLATVVAGTYPAWKAGRVDPVDSIKLV